MAKRADEITVVGLCGSLREGSVTRHALKLALDGAAQAGARTQLIDLREWSLPFAGSDFSPGEFPDVARLREAIVGAQGLVWATPEYHGSFSGVLKNALDLLNIDDFENKMLGLLAVAGGSVGATSSLSQLRAVGRQLHAWVLPGQVSIGSSYKAFNADGSAASPDIEKRLREMGRDVARFSFLHSQADDAFVQMWESAREHAEA
jgi:NAD(P)H-dependent FMN reductase